MSFAFNQVTVGGNLTRAPEIKYTQSGAAVCEISIAVNDRYKGKSGEWIERVDYIDCTAWARTAEIIAEYCQKGDPILVAGKLRLDTWEADGQKRSKLRVVIERLQLVGGRKGQGQGGGKQYSDDEAPYQGGGSKSKSGGAASGSKSADAGYSAGSDSGYVDGDDIPF